MLTVWGLRDCLGVELGRWWRLWTGGVTCLAVSRMWLPWLPLPPCPLLCHLELLLAGQHSPHSLNCFLATQQSFKIFTDSSLYTHITMFYTPDICICSFRNPGALCATADLCGLFYELQITNGWHDHLSQGERFIGITSSVTTLFDQSVIRMIPANTSLSFCFQITTSVWHHGNLVQINLQRNLCWTDIEMDCAEEHCLSP